jgi:hypothetical protein
MGILSTIKSKIEDFKSEDRSLNEELQKRKNMEVNERAKYSAEYIGQQQKELEDKIAELPGKYLAELQPAIEAAAKESQQEYWRSFVIPQNVINHSNMLVLQYQGAAGSKEKSAYAQDRLNGELADHLKNETIMAWAYANAINSLFPEQQGIKDLLQKSEDIMLKQIGSQDIINAKKAIVEAETAGKVLAVEIQRMDYIAKYNAAEAAKDAAKMSMYMMEIKRLDELAEEIKNEL